MSEYTLRFDWTKPPMSMNDRTHWRAKAATVARVRNTTHLLAKAARIPTSQARATVTLHYRPRDNRRRDADNLIPVLKAACDGLVDFGLTADDTPDLMTKTMPVIHPAQKGTDGALWLTITTQEADRDTH